MRHVEHHFSLAKSTSDVLYVCLCYSNLYFACLFVCAIAILARDSSIIFSNRVHNNDMIGLLVREIA